MGEQQQLLESANTQMQEQQDQLEDRNVHLLKSQEELDQKLKIWKCLVNTRVNF